MPLAETTEVQAVISAYYGADASRVPSGFELALWAGVYGDGGVEFDYPGYARVSLTNDLATFVDNGDGSATATGTFPDATDAATTDNADRWVLFNADTGDASATEFLDAPIAIAGAGSIEPVDATVYQPNVDLLGT